MECLYCQTQNQQGMQSCIGCGRPLPRYTAPEGFLFDAARGYYLKRAEKGGIVKTVFFDPVSGQYTVEEQPAVTPLSAGILSPEAPIGVLVMPEPVSATDTSSPAIPVLAPLDMPDGFVMDPVSGLGYRVDDSGMEGNEQVWYITWLEPATQEYAQVRYFAETAPASAILQTDGMLPVSVAQPTEEIPPAVSVAPPTEEILPAVYATPPTEEIPPAVYAAPPTEEIPTAVYAMPPTEEIPPVVYATPPTEEIPTDVYNAPPTEQMSSAYPTPPADDLSYVYHTQSVASSKAGSKVPLLVILTVVVVASLGLAGWVLYNTGALGRQTSSGTGKPEMDAEETGSMEDSLVGESTGDSALAGDGGSKQETDALTWTEPLIEQAARDYIGKPEGDITQEELEDIHTIYLFGDTVAFNENEPEGEEFEWGSIDSLTDMSNFPALLNVCVIDNPVSDLSTLRGHETIHQVMVMRGEVQDVSPMADLPDLKNLFLDWNQISDISPLAECEKLEYVSLLGNQITDASPLSGLTALGILDLRDNPIEDWSVVEHIEDLRGPLEDAEGSADWAVAYADFLQSDYFYFREFDFFGEWHRLLTQDGQGVSLAVASAAFYQVPEYDYPIMILTEYMQSFDDFDKIDTFAFEVPYIIKDDKVTNDISELKRYELFYEDDVSGYQYVDGDELARFGLTSVFGEDKELEDMLQEVYDWLSQQ